MTAIALTLPCAPDEAIKFSLELQTSGFSAALSPRPFQARHFAILRKWLDVFESDLKPGFSETGFGLPASDIWTEEDRRARREQGCPVDLKRRSPAEVLRDFGADLEQRAQQVFIERGVTVLQPRDLQIALGISPAATSRLVGRLIARHGFVGVGRAAARKLVMPGIDNQEAAAAKAPASPMVPKRAVDPAAPAVDASEADWIMYRDRVLRKVLLSASKPLSEQELAFWTPDLPADMAAGRADEVRLHACGAALTRLRIRGFAHRIDGLWKAGPAPAGTEDFRGEGA